jgi:phosphate-selective porin OprO/OprP
LHVGASGRQASTVGDQIVFRTRPPIRTGLSTVWPTPANTGTLFGDDMQWLNGELVAVYGSWTMQAEYLVSGLQDARSAAAAPPVGNVTYHGGYFQILYFLTGESDNYNKKTGAFDRVLPTESFFRVRDESGSICRGSGAWQIGARYNYLDVNDQGLNGGILHDISAGVNWFLNPNAKLQFDYSALYRDAPLAAGLGDGWVHSWGSRLAFDF